MWLLVIVQNGVERGDVLDELCGDPVLSSTHGRVKLKICCDFEGGISCFVDLQLKQVLQTNSELKYATDIVIVKVSSHMHSVIFQQLSMDVCSLIPRSLPMYHQVIFRIFEFSMGIGGSVD